MWWITSGHTIHPPVQRAVTPNCYRVPKFGLQSSSITGCTCNRMDLTILRYGYYHGYYHITMDVLPYYHCSVLPWTFKIEGPWSQKIFYTMRDSDAHFTRWFKNDCTNTMNFDDLDKFLWKYIFIKKTCNVIQNPSVLDSFWNSISLRDLHK